MDLTYFPISLLLRPSCLRNGEGKEGRGFCRFYPFPLCPIFVHISVLPGLSRDVSHIMLQIQSHLIFKMTGWEQQEEAYGCADYLAGELAANNYEGVVIQVKVPKGAARLQILVFPEQGQGYRLVCEEDVAALVAMACNGTLFADSEMSDDRAAAGDWPVSVFLTRRSPVPYN